MRYSCPGARYHRVQQRSSTVRASAVGDQHLIDQEFTTLLAHRCACAGDQAGEQSAVMRLKSRLTPSVKQLTFESKQKGVSHPHTNARFISANLTVNLNAQSQKGKNAFLALYNHEKKCLGGKSSSSSVFSGGWRSTYRARYCHQLDWGGVSGWWILE